MIACFVYCTAMYRGYIISHCDIFVNSVAGICKRHAEGIGPPPVVYRIVMQSATVKKELPRKITAAKRRRLSAKNKVGFADLLSAVGFVDITEISKTIFSA